MKWKAGESLLSKIERRRHWKRWFAWHPVKVSETEWRWLEFVERRLTRHGVMSEEWWQAHYRATPTLSASSASVPISPESDDAP